MQILDHDLCHDNGATSLDNILVKPTVPVVVADAEEEKLSDGAIAGIVIGSVALALLLVLCICLCCFGGGACYYFKSKRSTELSQVQFDEKNELLDMDQESQLSISIRPETPQEPTSNIDEEEEIRKIKKRREAQLLSTIIIDEIIDSHFDDDIIKEKVKARNMRIQIKKRLERDVIVKSILENAIDSAWFKISVNE